jgi:hypothetical protein
LRFALSDSNSLFFAFSQYILDAIETNQISLVGSNINVDRGQGLLLAGVRDLIKTVRGEAKTSPSLKSTGKRKGKKSNIVADSQDEKEDDTPKKQTSTKRRRKNVESVHLPDQ